MLHKYVSPLTQQEAICSCGVMLQGSSLAYFKSAWNIVDFLSTALLFACVIVWWDFALQDALPFDINLRYATSSCLCCSVRCTAWTHCLQVHV